MKMQESGENYLETILVLKQERGVVRSVDIAQRMEFTKPSISRAMSLLRGSGHITMDRDGFIELTPLGRQVAERIYERHRVLTGFLMALGVPSETAAQDACKIEHDLSAETFERMKKHAKSIGVCTDLSIPSAAVGTTKPSQPPTEEQEAAQRLILAVNPGSTSTKIALYKEKACAFSLSIEHTQEELEPYVHIAEQYELRKNYILDTLHQRGFHEQQLSAVVGRGGLLPPCRGGAYLVNELMIDRLRNRPLVEHASNLGAIMAYNIAQPLGIPSMIYDPVTTDELSQVARISGLPQLPRVSKLHALNSRAMAHKAAQWLGKRYQDCNLIVAHLGGGVSYSAHKGGEMVDVVLDDEGSFSPQRAGGLPSDSLVDLCFSGKYTMKQVKRLIRGEGGLKAYLNMVDARQVEERIKRGDEHAKTVYFALAYQAAKSIAQLAVVFSGRVDAVVITGGLAYSEMLVKWITEMVSFLAPVRVMPGEVEMEALAYGALRVLSGEEEPHAYSEP